MLVKVLIDTNVWVSALINPKGAPAKVKDAWIKNKFEALISLPILEELTEVLQRPRIKNKYQLTDEEIAQFLTLINHKAKHVVIARDLKICRDPDDNLVLETALKGNAQYMVSRDDDIKRDEEIIRHMEERGIRVMTVSKFLALLSSGKL